VLGAGTKIVPAPDTLPLVCSSLGPITPQHLPDEQHEASNDDRYDQQLSHGNRTCTN
jgi:hypothetical protein